MKTYGFNLLPQKSRALVRKEDKRDNYSVAIAILPLTGVMIWLALILVNFFIYEPQKVGWERTVKTDNAVIYTQLLPILVKNGEMVTKTNALANVIDKDVQPEQLFRLIDKIYGGQLDGRMDPTFRVTGYSRNSDGSFTVNITAVSYQRMAEITRLFSTYTEITGMKLDSASLDSKSNMIIGAVTFFFSSKNTPNNAGTAQ